MTLGERVAVVERHEPRPELVVGGMEADGEVHLPGRFSASRRIPGTTPTVETVIERAPMPITSIIRRSDSRTLG